MRGVFAENAGYVLDARTGRQPAPQFELDRKRSPSLGLQADLLKGRLPEKARNKIGRIIDGEVVDQIERPAGPGAGGLAIDIGNQRVTRDRADVRLRLENTNRALDGIGDEFLVREAGARRILRCISSSRAKGLRAPHCRARRRALCDRRNCAGSPACRRWMLHPER